jgi:hypothetical protein
MPRVLDTLRSNVAYAFIVVGAIWLGVAFNARSYLALWPVATSLLSGLLLRMRPNDRLTWAWASSSAVLGLLLSAYQAYVAIPLVGGALTSVASISLGGFSAFALVHLLILYAGNSAPAQPK